MRVPAMPPVQNRRIPIIHVAVNGNDMTGDGTNANPFRTLEELRRRQARGVVGRHIGLVLYGAPLKIEGEAPNNRASRHAAKNGARQAQHQKSSGQQKKDAALPWRERSGRHMGSGADGSDPDRADLSYGG